MFSGKKKNKSANKDRKKILLVCGSGIVTSTLIMSPIEDILKEAGLKYKIVKGSVGEIEAKTKSDKYNMIISTLEFDESIVNCPVVMARELLSGVPSEELKNKIVNGLQ